MSEFVGHFVPDVVGGAFIAEGLCTVNSQIMMLEFSSNL